MFVSDYQQILCHQITYDTYYKHIICMSAKKKNQHEKMEKIVANLETKYNLKLANIQLLF